MTTSIHERSSVAPVSAVEPADLATPISSATPMREPFGLRESGHFGDPDAVGKIVEALGGGLQAETGLARSADTGQSDQPTVGEALHCFAEFVYSSHERAQLDGEIVEVGAECFEVAELGSQVGMRQLVEMLRRSKILEPVFSQISQVSPVREPSFDQITRRRRHENLATVAPRRGCVRHDSGLARNSRRLVRGRHPHVRTFAP